MFGSAFHNETLARPGLNYPDPEAQSQASGSWQEAEDMQEEGGTAVNPVEEEACGLKWI